MSLSIYLPYIAFPHHPSLLDIDRHVTGKRIYLAIPMTPVCRIRTVMLGAVGSEVPTASGSPTSISGQLRLLVVSSTEIIGAVMDDDGPLSTIHQHSLSFPIQACLRPGREVAYTQNALGTDQLDVLVRHGRFDVALVVGLEVAHVADMAVLVVWGAMCLVEWVDWIEEGDFSHHPLGGCRSKGNKGL